MRQRQWWCVDPVRQAMLAIAIALVRMTHCERAVLEDQQRRGCRIRKPPDPGIVAQKLRASLSRRIHGLKQCTRQFPMERACVCTLSRMLDAYIFLSLLFLELFRLRQVLGSRLERGA